MSNTTPHHSPDARQLRVCLVSSVPSTLAAFYTPLIHALVDSFGRVDLITSPGQALSDLSTISGVNTHTVPMSRSISPLRDLRSVRHLARLLRAGEYDLVHTHTPKAGLVGMLAARLAKVPHRLHTLHGLPLETATGTKRLLLTQAERLTCALADHLCVVSASLQQRADELRLCSREKMQVLEDGTACGVDLERFNQTPEVKSAAIAIRRDLNIDQDATIVGFVGWMVADKGVTELVAAFDALATERDDVYLLMIGADGSERDPLPRKTLDAVRNHPRIKHVGLVANPVPYYATMDVCILPTRREGFPYALLEAGAMGVPVVATRVTGCVDAVRDGKTGLLVPLGDVDALTDAIRRITTDAELRSALGHAAKHFVRTTFGSDRLVRAHLDLYRSLTATT